MLTACGTSKKLNKLAVDERSGKTILVGEVNKQAFEKDEFKTWYNSQYNNYKPETEVIEQLKKNEILSEIEIVVVFGSWCGDSRRELPRFYKILDEINFPKKNITVIAVDRTKKGKHKIFERINVQRVPTFYFYKDEKLIGKIVETPVKSLEEDMLEIIIKK